jgi:probable FeS assembly SUF system protein SufT
MLLMPRERVQLTRDVTAIEVPSGAARRLERGQWVTITQSLGGSYTILSDSGIMARIDGRDADALGKAAEAGATASPTEAAAGEKPLAERVRDALRTCYDPEIPVNIVELGLVYRCEVTPMPPPLAGGAHVDIAMTLTAPGCGMGDILKRDIERKVREIPGVDEVHVEVVLDPPWDPSRMSDAARLQLGMM